MLRHERENAQPAAMNLSDQRKPHIDGVPLLAEPRLLGPLAKRAFLIANADIGAAIAAINTTQVLCHLQKPWGPSDRLLYPAILIDREAPGGQAHRELSRLPVGYLRHDLARRALTHASGVSRG